MKKQFQNMIGLFFFLSFWSLKGQVSNFGKLYFGEESKVLIGHDFYNIQNADFYNDGLFYLIKNFNNDGVVDFLSPEGKIIFSGTEKQYLRGNGLSYFSEVYFDHSKTNDAFQLETELFVENAAAFLNGIIHSDNRDGLMVFGDKSQVKTISEKSFVEGFVEKTGDSDFQFPIGDKGFYRPGAISGLSGSGVYRLQYKLEKASTDFILKNADLTYINDKEYWVLDTPKGSNGKMFLSLSYSLLTSPMEIIRAAQSENLCVVKWNDQSGGWTSYASVLDKELFSVAALISDPGIYTLGICATDEECEIHVYNLIDVSGSSNNKYMRITTDCTLVRVSVFNRWGIKVFESENYGLQGDVFDGYSSGRFTINKKDYLPDGSYLYVIEYKSHFDNDNRVKQRIGYVYVKSD